MHCIAHFQVRSALHSWLHSIVHSQPAWLTLPSKLSRYSQEHSEYAPKYTSEYIPKYTSEYVLKYTPGHAPKDTPTCTRWHTPSLLDCPLPSKLSRRSQAHSQVRSQGRSQLHSIAHSQPACLYDHKYAPKTLPSALRVRSHVHLRVALKYAPNCSRWYTRSLLGSTLPSTLSRGKTLPISLDYCSHVYCCMLVSETCCVAGSGRLEAGGVWRVAAGGGVVKRRC